MASQRKLVWPLKNMYFWMNMYFYMSRCWITTCATQIRDDEALNYIEFHPELGLLNR